MDRVLFGVDGLVTVLMVLNWSCSDLHCSKNKFSRVKEIAFFQTKMQFYKNSNKLCEGQRLVLGPLRYF